VESADPLFDENKLRNLFKDLGAIKTEDIFIPEKEIFPVFQPKFLILLFITALVVSGGTYFTLNKLMYTLPFNWMMDQGKLNPQKGSVLFADGFGMRKPVEGTVARGFIPYPYKGELNPSQTLSNPLLPTKAVLELGKKKFLTFCSPCHGNFADGDSRLHGQFPNPPTLHSERARNFSDGMIFHIITNGQNVMPSYASQVTSEERWAIINYVRVLQRSKNASDSDLLLSKEESSKNVAK